MGRLHKVKSAIKRFNSAPSNIKIIKLKNRIKRTSKLHRIFYWELSKKFNRQELKVKRKELYFLPLSDSTISRNIFVEGQHDFEKLIKVSKLIPINDKTLIDVGANIGSICIPACKRKIVKDAIAIEPDKKSYYNLERNIKINKLNNILTFNSVAGAIKDQVLFGSKFDNPGDSKVTNQLNNSEFSKIYYVSQFTLNTLLKHLSPHKVIIWIDVQGYEPQVLQGATDFIKSRTPLVIEVFPLAINLYSSFKKLEESIENYTKFADLRYDISKPYFESIKNFKKKYHDLESSGSFSDFLFI